MDSLKRSVAKALSWRLFGTIITATLLYLATGQFAFAIGFGIIDTIVKLIVYFIHERLWERIKYGRTVDK